MILPKMPLRSIILVGGLIAVAPFARADLWGADVGVLVQILAEQVKKYYQLKSIIENGQDQMNLLRNLNSGIDNSITLLNSLPITDEKVLGEIREYKAAVDRVRTLYGKIPKSRDEAMQRVHDDTIAESLKMANSFKDFAEIEEKNSEVIAVEARAASPKGAERMQAATSAEILKSLSQLLRLNTQILKLQSEQLAISNKSAKDGVTNFQRVNADLGKGFSELKLDMELERF